LQPKGAPLASVRYARQGLAVSAGGTNKPRAELPRAVRPGACCGT
jgi:hypothetical protein